MEPSEQRRKEAKNWEQILDEFKNDELSIPPGFEVPRETFKQSMILQSFKILGTVEPESLNALEDSE